jgi:hypothetical protein
MDWGWLLKKERREDISVAKQNEVKFRDDLSDCN